MKEDSDSNFDSNEAASIKTESEFEVGYQKSDRNLKTNKSKSDSQ